MSCIVKIVSVGPGNPELMNQKTVETVLNTRKLILRTGRHPVSGWLDLKAVPYRTMDMFYESSEDFDRLFSDIAKEIWKEAAEHGSVVYAVPDALTDHSVDAIFSLRPEHGMAEVVPGFSFADFYLSSCRGFFPVADIRICSASDFSEADFDPSLPFLITELNDGITAGEIKTKLSDFINDEDTVYFLDAQAAPRPVPLYELDRQPVYDHLSAVAGGGRSFLHRNAKTLSDLLRIMDLLRSPEGCPWDRAQTHESLRPYVVEEAWEVVDSIDAKDPVHLADELGDLLFQVVFHASIGKNFDEFTMNDIITGISNKMIRRHPHVFLADHPGRNSFSAEKWEQLKQAETGSKTVGRSLEDVSSSLPSLRYAEKIIRKLGQLPLLKRTDEEIRSDLAAHAEALRNANQEDVEQALGSLLLLCAELSQRLEIDSEVLLHHVTGKIVESFRKFEENQDQDALQRLTFNDFGVY